MSTPSFEAFTDEWQKIAAFIVSPTGAAQKAVRSGGRWLAPQDAARNLRTRLRGPAGHDLRLPLTEKLRQIKQRMRARASR